MVSKLKLLYNNASQNKVLAVIFVIAMHLISFFVPLFLVTSLFKSNGYYPFVKDGQSLLMLDMQGQYIAFFRYYKGILDGDFDLLYTLGKASGGDMLSLFTYYLASPFNLILKFFSLEELPAGLMWIVCLKVATSGLTAYTALRVLNTKGRGNLLLSITYALIAYNFVYYSNIMWLDGVIAVPLIALGVIKIIRKESYMVYIFSLAYAIMTNWYIGIMLCVFSVLFFGANLLLETKDRRKIRSTLLVFTLSSLTAGLISFAFWGTAVINIMGTKGGSSFTQLNYTIYQFYNTLNIARAFFFGSYQGRNDITGTTVAFYVGALPLLLTLLLLVNPGIKLEARLPIIALFSIYLLAFFNRGLDHLFHGGPQPNWFPGRYTFIFGFILIYYGSVSLNRLNTLKYYSFLYPLIAFIFAYIFINKLGFQVNNKSITFFSAAFLIVLALYLLTHVDTFKKTKTLSHYGSIKLVANQGLILGLSLLSIMNVYENANHILWAFDYNQPTLSHVSIEKYRENEKIARAIDYIKEMDTSLYRMEKGFVRSETYNRANNDAMYYGYNGLSHYSSNEKQSTLNYMRKIGFHYNGFNENYENGSTLTVNSYLGVKYLLDDGRNLGFNLTKYLPILNDTDFEDIAIYENPYALPFLYPTETLGSTYIGEGEYLEDGSIYWYDIFEYQNNIFKHLIKTVVDDEGKQKDIFKKAIYNKTLINVTEKDEAYHYQVEDIGSIRFSVQLSQPSNYYYYFHTSNNSDLSLIANGYKQNYYFTYHGHQIDGLQTDNLTTNITVNISAPKNDVKIQEAIYYEDLSVLEEYVTAIKNRAKVEITQKKSSQYVASVETKEDNQAMLLTLPYDKHIRVFVDGKKVDTMTRFNIFTGFNIKHAGQHKIEIKFVQPSFQAGIPLTIIASVITLCSPLILKTYNDYKKKKKRQIA